MSFLTLLILYLIYRQCGGTDIGCLSGCAGLFIKFLCVLLAIAILLASCGAMMRG